MHIYMHLLFVLALFDDDMICSVNGGFISMSSKWPCVFKLYHLYA